MLSPTRQPPDQADYENVVREACAAVGRVPGDKETRGAHAMKWPEALQEALQI
ncbi:MAG: hypothetical protein ABR508_08870 [Candidatus Baltobacteraceae bacterium]